MRHGLAVNELAIAGILVAVFIGKYVLRTALRVTRCVTYRILSADSSGTSGKEASGVVNETVAVRHG